MGVLEILETMEYGPAPEGSEPVKEWIERHKGRFGMYIDGAFAEPRPDQLFETLNPATGKPLAQVTQATAEDVDAAVSAAKKAFPAWSGLSGHARARYLYALARQVQKHARFLAVLETLDNGKPIRESRDIDIPLVARHFYHHAGWAQLMEEEFAGYVPVGVVGQIIPWNFPLLMLAWKVAPALAMGNTVVLKPAEFTSLTALAFAELCDEVGLPPGVVNIVTGDGAVGELIVKHDGIDKIAFTGSTEVGRIIRKATAGTGKKLSLELGGKSPFVVFDDADLDSAIEGVVDAIWFNQGQVCCAGSRLLVQESCMDRFIAKLKKRMEKLRMGDPMDKGIDMGAIVAPTQLEKIQNLVAQGEAEGVEVWQPSWAVPKEGFFYPPTLVTRVSPASVLAQVEIFGPVITAMSFRTPKEAVELANNTTYGLAASIWTENINLALDVASQVKAGTVWVNCTNLFDAASGFGGYRESGFGREGGREGLWEYVRPAWETAGEPKDARKAKAKTPKTEDASDEAADFVVSSPREDIPAIDRTPKMYIGGKQARPDAPYSRHILSPAGVYVGEVGEGNRKDIRNAVEAAVKAKGWGTATGHNRAQILYYIAENLSARAGEFEARIDAMTGCGRDAAKAEVATAIERLFTYAAWADKFDGAVHRVPSRNVTLAMPEPIGVMGIACPDVYPLLGFISTAVPAIAMGNRVVAIPSEPYPLAATDLYQVFDTSDVPGGVVNIVTGSKDELAEVLANHDAVEAVWYFGSAKGSAAVEAASAGNMKRTWVDNGRSRDWMNAEQGQGEEFLRQATHVKNIWVPYGE